MFVYFRHKTRALCALILALVALAVPAMAQDFPARYNVIGVASNDSLNVRTRPNAASNVIGTLDYDAQGVEVIAEENGWGQVNVDGRTGWASLRFLERIEASTLAATHGFICFGTEPFWSLDVVPGQRAIFSTPEGADKIFVVGTVQAAQARWAPHAVLGADGSETLTAVIDHQICSDGMSDNLFGLSTTLVISGQDTRVLSGCCTLETP